MARYAALLAALWIAVTHGGDWLLQSTVRSFDPLVMTLPIDDAVVDNHRIAASPTKGDTEPAASATSDDGFDHARPAPRLFERVSTREAEKLKASVRDTVVADGSEGWYHGTGGTYRTVCVRLCDGAYFPVSYSTTRNRFERDEAVCKSKCGAPARLFVAPNPGGSPENMRDRNGASYIALPTAFQFRKGNVSGCSCRAEAWETASLERHRGYQTAAAAKTNGTSTAVAKADKPMPTQSRVAGWNSARDAGTGPAIPVGFEPSQPVAAIGELPTVTRAKLPPAAITVAKLDVPQQSGQHEFIHQNSDTIVTSSLSAVPAATEQRSTAIVRALKSLPPQVVVKARTVKTAGKRPAVAKRRPPSSDEFVLDNVSIFAPAALAAQLPKATPTWGIGPNSRSAPRGNSASEVFARNFY